MTTETRRQKIVRLYVSQIGYDPFSEPVMEDGTAPTVSNVAQALREYALCLISDQPELAADPDIQECLSCTAQGIATARLDGDQAVFRCRKCQRVTRWPGYTTDDFRAPLELECPHCGERTVFSEIDAPGCVVSAAVPIRERGLRD